MNFTHDEWIHWFKQWVTEWKRSEFQLWSKDSLTQTLIPYMWEEWISVTTEWFTNILKERGANFSHDQTIHTFKESTNARAVNFSHDSQKWFPRYMWEEWISFMTEWFTDSLNDTGMNLGHELKKIRWSKHRVAEQDRNEFQACGKGFTNANLGSASTQLQTHNSWTFQNSDRTTVCINYVRQV